MADALLDFLMRQGVHFAGRLPDQESEHLCLGHELYEWELNALIQGERFSERGAGSCIGDTLADAKGCGAEAGGCLSNAVLVQEGLGYGESVVRGAEDGVGGDKDVSEGGGCVVGRHVECPSQG